MSEGQQLVGSPYRSRGTRAAGVQSGRSSPTGQGRWGRLVDGVVRIGFSLFSESKVLLELDRKVLCSMWSAPIPLIPKSRGAS